MKKHSLYIKDSQALRVTLCIYLVFVELFQFLWKYFISPISDRYLLGFSDPYTVTSLCLTIVYTITFVILSFFDYKKSWKSHYVFFGITFILDAALLIIQTFKKSDSLISDTTTSFILISLSFIVFAIFCFLMLTEKRFFKYTLIVFSAFFLLSNIVNIVDFLDDIINPPDFRTAYVYNQLLSDWEEPFFSVSAAIDSIPTFILVIFILTIFIKVKKTEKNQPKYTYTNQANNVYQPYQNSAIPQTVATVTQNVKYCPKCGTQANSEDVFCKRCGNRFI